MRRLTALLAASMVLMGIGGLATLGSLAIMVERDYIATVTAPQGVTWNVWLPSPKPFVAPTSEDANVIGIVETPPGPLVNVTGVGSATVHFESESLEFVFESSPAHRGFDLTGREGDPSQDTFAVWRSTTDPGADVTVAGVHHWTAANLGGSLSCEEPGYSGPLVEGWNHLPIGGRDCIGLGLFNYPFLLPTLLFLMGGIGLAVNRHRRRRLARRVA